MNQYLPKMLLSILTVTIAVIVWSPFDKGEGPPMGTKVEILPKKKKTLEEKAQTVGERLQFEFDLQKNPKTGRIPEGIKEMELKAAKKAPIFGGEEKNSSDLEIDVRGPGNLGGRTRAIGIDVQDSDIMLAGGVSSGMFRSTDGGTSWTKVSANDEIHNVTAIAQDTRAGQEDTWYYGTGETGSSAGLGSLYLGYGIWKSTDNGLTWAALASTQSALETFNSAFDFVHRIVVDPTNGDVYAATSDVIQRSTNGGTSWTTVLGSLANNAYTDIVVTSTGRLYAAFDGGDGSDGVHTSTDGTTWTKIGGSGAATNHANWNVAGNYGRIVLAIAPSDEDMLFALYDNDFSSSCTGTAGPEAELFRWDQGTTTWTDLSANLPDEGNCHSGNDPFAIQRGYDLVVAVKPDDANTVFVGGTNIYRSTDGFTSNTNTTRIGGYAAAGTYAKYSVGGVIHHPDIHTIAFASDDNDVLYCGSDGGIHSADITNASVEWTSLNNNYITYQYYHAEISPTDGNDLLIGGAQDNGTTAIGSGTTAVEIGSGDGVAVGLVSGTDEDNLNAILGTQNGSIIRRVISGGVTTQYWNIRPTSAVASLFITYFHLDQDNTDHLYYAADGDLYRTRTASTINGGTEIGDSDTGWEELTGIGSATGGDIRSMATSRNDAFAGADYSASDASRKLFIGTSNGDVFRLDDPAYTAVGTAPVDITPSGAGSGIVSGIAVNPEDDNEVLVVYANYGLTNVFHTTDANSATPTWTAVEGATTAVQLASIRSCAIINGESDTYYFIGTSTGMYCTTTLSGATTDWGRVAPDDIGYAVTSSLRVRPSDDNMVVGTHGNGMFQLAVLPPAGCEELFFSEYIEGSSNNKCLEIYNPTGSTVDLAALDYEIKIHFGGSSSVNTVDLSGSVASGDVYVVCNTSASSAFSSQEDQESGSMTYNGDDAIELQKGGATIDVIGQIGSDPGSQWGSGLNSTQDNTIRRKSTIQTGDVDGSDAFDPSIEWDGYAQNNADNLGSHTSDCVACTSLSVSVTAAILKVQIMN